MLSTVPIADRTGSCRVVPASGAPRVGLGSARATFSRRRSHPMTSQKRRAAGRRRAWGRGPIILRFESLEGRQLLSASSSAKALLPDLVGSSFATAHGLDWG